MQDPQTEENLKNKSEEYWKKKLDPATYHVVREKGTEASHKGKFVNNFDTGMYECVACGVPLFSSETKFHSDCGWPSFDRTLASDNVEFHEDNSFGMHRIEITCKRCGGHLGHLFDDGPTETGKRYCINSLSLNFKPESTV